MNEQQPVKVVVELVSSADVKRLEDRDEELRKEIAQLERRIEGLHRSFYEALDALTGKKRNR